jgi:hypothetical protein
MQGWLQVASERAAMLRRTSPRKKGKTTMTSMGEEDVDKPVHEAAPGDDDASSPLRRGKVRSPSMLLVRLMRRPPKRRMLLWRRHQPRRSPGEAPLVRRWRCPSFGSPGKARSSRWCFPSWWLCRRQGDGTPSSRFCTSSRYFLLCWLAYSYHCLVCS